MVIDRLLAWWWGRRMVAHQRELADEPRERVSLTVPLELGVKLSYVDAEIKRRGINHYVTDSVPELVLRTRWYGLGYNVNVSYRYHEDDGTVWAIGLSSAARRYTAQLGWIALDERIEPIAATLGEPVAEHQRAPVLRELLFLDGEHGYIVEIYSQDYPDIAGYYRQGDVDSVEWFSRELAPRGYPEWAPADVLDSAG